MTVRQAGAPITDDGLFDAARAGGVKNTGELLSIDNKDGPLSLRDTKCRLYPKISFFSMAPATISTSILHYNACRSGSRRMAGLALGRRPRRCIHGAGRGARGVRSRHRWHDSRWGMVRQRGLARRHGGVDAAYPVGLSRSHAIVRAGAMNSVNCYD